MGIIILMMAVAVGAVMAIRWLTGVKTESDLSDTAANQNISVSGVLPRAANPGVQSWSGTLGLGQTATLNTGGKIYTLFIAGGANTILGQQGYKTGDKVVIMGRLKDNVIEVVGTAGMK